MEKGLKQLSQVFIIVPILQAFEEFLRNIACNVLFLRGKNGNARLD
jgi:hypothetical protein